MYRKFRRLVGGRIACPTCGRDHAAVMRVKGVLVRPKACVDCGAVLPLDAWKGRKGRWTIEIEEPGRPKRHVVARSSENADKIINQMRRAWSADPTRRDLIEQVTLLVRQASDGLAREQIVDHVIRGLGGDVVSRSLTPIGIAEGIQRIADEVRRATGASVSYVEDVERTAADFAHICGLGNWSDASVEHVKVFAAALSSGEWKRAGRRVRAVGSWSIRRHLATLHSFLTRASENKWINPAILSGSGAWAQQVSSVAHDYMPDADLAALLDAAKTRWLTGLVMLAYNTSARRGDLLALTWADLDLDGMGVASGGQGVPTARIANTKRARRQVDSVPICVPLDESVVAVLKDLRAHPESLQHPQCPLADRVLLVDGDGRALDAEYVFPVRGYLRPGCLVSVLFTDLCVSAGLKNAQGEHRWTLHDLRRKANDDLQRAGASLREAMALTGHASVAVNVKHYQSADPARMKELVGKMTGMSGLKGRKVGA